MKLLTLQSVLLWGLAVVLACAGSLMAGERLTIGQLKKHHASYHRHSVTHVGKVAAMHASPPLHIGGAEHCSPLYGIAEFVLVDDTGSLPVESLGSCLAAAMELPHDGDLIELTAEILVFVPQGQRAQVIKAITEEIVVVK